MGTSLAKINRAAFAAFLLGFVASAHATAISSLATAGNWSATSSWSGGVVPASPVQITSCTNNGSGLIRVTLATSATYWATNDEVNIYGVVGTTVANSGWLVTRINASSTTYDLQGSTFGTSYVSGGFGFHGDNVTIISGSTITIDSAACDTTGLIIIGTNSTVNNASTIDSTTNAATLNENSGLKLRLRGYLTFSGANASFLSTINVSSGSSVIFDPPSGNHYILNMVGATSVAINLNGTTNTGNWPDTTGGNHVIWTTDLARGGTNSFMTNITGSSFTGGLITGTFTEFSNIGSTVGGSFGIATSIAGGTIGTWSVTNCTFLNSNYTFTSDNGPNTNNVYTFNNNIVTNSVNQALGYGPQNTCFIFTLKESPTVPPQLIGNSFDQTSLATLDGMANAKIQGNVFAGGLQVNEGNYAPGAPNDTYQNNNFIAIGLPGEVAGLSCKFGNSKNNYFLNASAGINNLAPITGSTVSACVFEFNGSRNTNTGINSADNNYSVINSLQLPNSSVSGDATPMIFIQGSTGVIANHDLWFAGASIGNGGLVELFGTNSTAALSSAQSDITYWDSATANGSAVRSNTASQLNTVTLAGYNGFKNPNTGTCKYNAGVSTVSLVGYDGLEVTNATPFAAQGTGAGNTQIQSGFDFTSDPKFLDQTYRGIALWGGTSTGGGVATVNAAVTKLISNPALVAQAGTGLLAWVKAGYIPTNPSYLGATYPSDKNVTDANGLPNQGTVGPMAFITSYYSGSPISVAAH